MTHLNQQELERRYDELYERFAKPLEEEHRGEFLAVSKEGKTIFGSDLLELAEKATAELGPDNFIFKLGEKSVGHWR